MPRRSLTESEFNAIEDDVLAKAPPGLDEASLNKYADVHVSTRVLAAEAATDAAEQPRSWSNPDRPSALRLGWEATKGALGPPIDMLKGMYTNAATHARQLSADVDAGHPLDAAYHAVVGSPAGQVARTVRDLAKGQWNQGVAAKDAYQQGRTSEAVGHGLAAITPGAGPFAAGAAEEIGTGDPLKVAHGVGGATALLAPPIYKGVKAGAVALGRSAAAAPMVEALDSARTGVADALDRSANKRIVDVIAPKYGKNAKNFGGNAVDVAPDLVKNADMGALSREGLHRKVGQDLDLAGQELDASHDARLKARTFETQPMIDAIEAKRAELEMQAVEGSRVGYEQDGNPSINDVTGEVRPNVKIKGVVQKGPIGENVVPSPHNARVAVLDQAVKELRQLGAVTTYDQIRKMRIAYDGPAKAVYSPAVTDNFLEAQGGKFGAADVTGALRDQLGQWDPATAEVNARYHVLAKANDVLEATAEVERVRPRRGQKLAARLAAGGIGLAAGATGGPLAASGGAAAGFFLAPILDEAMSSGFTTKIATARLLSKLADAIRKGDEPAVAAAAAKLKTPPAAPSGPAGPRGMPPNAGPTVGGPPPPGPGPRPLSLGRAPLPSDPIDVTPIEDAPPGGLSGRMAPVAGLPPKPTAALPAHRTPLITPPPADPSGVRGVPAAPQGYALNPATGEYEPRAYSGDATAPRAVPSTAPVPDPPAALPLDAPPPAKARAVRVGAKPPAKAPPVPAEVVAERAAPPADLPTMHGTADDLPAEPKAEPLSARAQQAADADSGAVQDLVDEAQKGGYTGDANNLRGILKDRLAMLRDGESAYAESGRNPDVLLREIAKRGGLNITKETGLVGEMRDLKESTQDMKPSASRKNLLAPDVVKSGQVRGIRGVFKNGAGGHAFDDMLSSLQDDPRFAHLKTLDDLREEVRDAAREGPAEAVLAQFRAQHGNQWWKRIGHGSDEALDAAESGHGGDDAFDPAELEEPAPGKVDTLDTGEHQPRLGGDVGAVRDRNAPMPDVASVPFSLAGEVAKVKPPTEGALFGKPPKGSRATEAFYNKATDREKTLLRSGVAMSDIEALRRKSPAAPMSGKMPSKRDLSPEELQSINDLDDIQERLHGDAPPKGNGTYREPDDAPRESIAESLKIAETQDAAHKATRGAVLDARPDGSVVTVHGRDYTKTSTGGEVFWTSRKDGLTSTQLATEMGTQLDRESISAADLAKEMSDLRRPRPIKKTYGNNPTPEQTAAHAKEMSAFNAKYRKLSAQHKIALERDNAAFRARSEIQGMPEREQDVDPSLRALWRKLKAEADASE